MACTNMRISLLWLSIHHSYKTSNFWKMSFDTTLVCIHIVKWKLVLLLIEMIAKLMPLHSQRKLKVRYMM